MDRETAQMVITILGKEKTEELYQYLRSKKVSFSVPHKIIEQDKICEILKSSKLSFAEIAKMLGVSRMTLYRIYHELVLKRL